MYAPKGKMGLTLKFTSQEGHFGTMQMTGGMSRSEELGECRRFWIEERQSVPGFLAQVTTEMFEKTTVSALFVFEPEATEGMIGEVETGWKLRPRTSAWKRMMAWPWRGVGTSSLASTIRYDVMWD
jgi:hypothetical protein